MANTDEEFDYSLFNVAPLSPMDPASFSRPDYAIMKHVSLSFEVDFECKKLHAVAIITFDVLKELNEIPLDVKNQKVISVELEDGTPLEHDINDGVEHFGFRLLITVPKQRPRNELKIKIKYSTAPSASALQWLDPKQTCGKEHPYLFSQCQPIHARSILPCQDTPAVKFTYDAKVTVPPPFTALMSAIRGDKVDNVTSFHQPIPIPAYLLAIAVGVLESRRLGPRSLVWAEKEVVEKAEWEFKDTEKYLEAAEKICGDYVWNKYDLLLLPPSFPYGGMENPCLTFVTPTLLSGDRSQSDLIIHEITHSWTGNLVTNKTFEHFWLNEGFTVFLERKIAASLIRDEDEAKKSRDFHSLRGLQELEETVKHFSPNNILTRLVPRLVGIHPDDAFSSVPYEKGSLFLRYLEDLVGGPGVFDNFVRCYIQAYKEKSLDSLEFKEFFLDYFKDHPDIATVDWKTWYYKVGMPCVIPKYDTTMTKAISELVTEIVNGKTQFSYQDVESFSPHQIIHLLQSLLDSAPLSVEVLRELGKTYKIEESKHSEVVYRWLRLCIKSRDIDALPRIFEFINGQGRMKFVRPIYRALYDWIDVRCETIDNFMHNAPYMMHVSAYTLRKDLHLIV